MKKIIPVFIAVALILLVGGLYFGQQMLDRYSYSREHADLNEYFGITGTDDVPVMLNDEWIDVHARLFDGGCYLRHSDVDDLLNGRFYYGTEDQILVYTTPNAIITANVGQKEWSSTDGTSGQEEYPIALLEEDGLWLLLDYVEHYSDFSWNFFPDPARLRLKTEWTSFEQASVIKKTELRVRGGVKSEILRDVDKGEQVTVLEQMENWSRVRTADAFTGYIENKRLSDPIHAEAVAPESKTEEYPRITCEEPVVLAWHSIAGMGGNETLSSLLAATNAGEKNGLNTISPTWFALADDNGGITSFASGDYVRLAHDKGLKVWGLIDSFTGSGDLVPVLAHAASRRALTANLVDAALSVGLDGINVDFEGVPADSGEDFIEWIRELSISCRQQGLVLSVDNYVPMGNLNDYYDRAEQGVVADYVIIMGYDEHYRGSPEAGSVASIGYVEDGIRRTVSDVPADKVIGGIPFYTRVWATKDGSVTSDALSMGKAEEWIAQRGVKLQWDEGTCQNYGEIRDGDGTLRQIWMEDAESIRTKVTVMGTYEIAGVAAWQLGFETPDIWDAIASALP